MDTNQWHQGFSLSCVATPVSIVCCYHHCLVLSSLFGVISIAWCYQQIAAMPLVKEEEEVVFFVGRCWLVGCWVGGWVVD